MDHAAVDLDLINHSKIDHIYSEGMLIHAPERVFHRGELWGFSHRRGDFIVLIPFGAVTRIVLAET